MAEKNTQNENKIPKNEAEKKAVARLKMLDGMSAYIIALIIFAIAYTVGVKALGIWALYIASALTFISVVILIKITGLKASSVIKTQSPRKIETVGCALTLASAFMLSMPLILFSQIIAPRLAMTSFNIYEAVGEKGGAVTVLLLVLILSLVETLLFDGYIYSRFSGIKNIFLKAIFIGVMASVMKFDLYALPTAFVMSLAAFFLRKESGGLILSFIVRLFSVSFIMAMTNLSATSSELLGESMGVLQVAGLTLIFIGASLPCITGALGAFGKLGSLGKIFGFISVVACIVLVAAGCGVVSL